jgi:hypothetical protein
MVLLRRVKWVLYLSIGFGWMCRDGSQYRRHFGTAVGEQVNPGCIALPVAEIQGIALSATLCLFCNSNSDDTVVAAPSFACSGTD